MLQKKLKFWYDRKQGVSPCFLSFRKHPDPSGREGLTYALGRVVKERNTHDRQPGNQLLGKMRILKTEERNRDRMAENREMTIEICCGSYEDALAAARGGAERIELNSALALGGLTPSAACLRMVKRCTDLLVVSMVRPRGAGFCYTEAQTEQMFEEARELLENGSDGLAFGFLTEDRCVDLEKTGRMTELIHSYGREAVFHRAFDCTEDPVRAIEELIGLGADRILTSGQQEKAEQGKELLRQLQAAYGSRIQLLAGSGVNAGNARALAEYTGIRQLHSSCRYWERDVTTVGEGVNYSIAPAPHERDYDRVSERLVRELAEALRER